MGSPPFATDNLNSRNHAATSQKLKPTPAHIMPGRMRSSSTSAARYRRNCTTRVAVRKQVPIQGFPLGKTCQIDSRHVHAVEPNRVSGESFSKTGIFTVVAGDFCRIAPRTSGFGSSETQALTAKARQLRAFLLFVVRHLQSRDCLAGAGGFEPPYGGIKIRQPSERLQRSF